jgi:hypothetical protein
MDACPFCGGRLAGRCKCLRADSVCENGHEWHTCVAHGRVVAGASDHAEFYPDDCSCPKNEKEVGGLDKA